MAGDVKMGNRRTSVYCELYEMFIFLSLFCSLFSSLARILTEHYLYSDLRKVNMNIFTLGVTGCTEETSLQSFCVALFMLLTARLRTYFSPAFFRWRISPE